MSIMESLTGALNKWIDFWVNLFWSPIFRALIHFAKKVLSSYAGWVITAVAAVIAIATMVFNFVRRIIRNVQEIGLPDSEASAIEISGDVSWSDILEFLNYGLPLEELLTVAAVVFSVLVVCYIWRLIKSHIPTIAG